MVSGLSTAIPIRPAEGEQEERKSQALSQLARELTPYLAERNVVDVVVNPDGKIWVNRIGAGFEPVGAFFTQQIKLLLAQVAAIQGVDLSHDNPILETDFPLDGSRIEGLLSPVVRGAALALRPHPKKIFTIEDYESAGIITHKNDSRNKLRHKDWFLEKARAAESHGTVIKLMVQFRRNVLIVGSTGAGKSTLGNMFLDLIYRITPKDRVVTIEDTMELQCRVPNSIALFASARSRISMEQCLEASMRLKPDRIVVGEVRRRAAAVMLLQAWNTGHRGGIATVHAEDAISGLHRLEQLLPRDYTSVRPEIARAVDAVVFIDEDDEISAGRKVREVMVVKGYDEARDRYELEYV